MLEGIELWWALKHSGRLQVAPRKAAFSLPDRRPQDCDWSTIPPMRQVRGVDVKPNLKLQWLGKKRGNRRTGSHIAGSLGEAIFFGALFLLGTISLTALVASQMLNPTPELYRPGFGFWLIVLVLASLMVTGGIGVLVTVAQVGASAERRSDMVRRAGEIDLIREAMPSLHEFPNVPRDERLTDSPGVELAYRLPSEVQRTAWKLATMAVLSLLLSGFASVLGVLFANSLMTGEVEWSTLIFALPFLAVGVWSTYCFLREMWRFSRVGPTYVEISDFPLHPGEDYQVAVSQSGRFSLNSLQLSLVCEEEATYHQGTDVRVETRGVSHQEIAQREAVELDRGAPLIIHSTVSIPRDAAHSFQSNHNAVRWKLVVEGESNSHPRFVRNFPVIVYPAHRQPSTGKHTSPIEQPAGGARIVDHKQSVDIRQTGDGTSNQPSDSESQQNTGNR